MKKIWMIALLAVATAYSCAKINEQGTVKPAETPVPEKTEGRIVFNIQVNQAGAQTKAVKTGWETGDVVYVFFSGAAAPTHLKMTFDGTSWTSVEYDGTTPTPGALGLNNDDTGTMRAVFLPFGSDAMVSASGTSFVFDKTYYTYYLTASLPYTVKDNEVSGVLNMLIPDEYVQFFVEDAAAVDEAYTLGTDAVVPVGVASIAADGTITETSDKVAGNDMMGYAYQGGYLFSGKLDGSYAYSGSYYLAKTKTADNSRADYFVSGKTLASHDAVKLPANDNVYAVVSGTPNAGKWVPVGSDITVQLYKSGTSLGEWYSCNYGQSVPESIDVTYTPGSAYALGVTLPSEDQLKGINDNCSFTLLTVHGQSGSVVKADSGFLFLPHGTWSDVYLSSTPASPGSSDARGLTILTNGSHYMYTYSSSYPYCLVRPVNNYVDLSASATANSYIVPTAGKYKFKATVKGNGYADLAGISKDTDPATIASAELVWATFNTTVAPAAGELIKDISYADGYVYFSTGDTYKEGNALVAIKDGSGNILWSWHIWFHNYDESYLTGANSVQMMNRNLGALSTSVGSPLSYGMYYQWGRKDPFVGPGSGTTLAAVQGTEKSVQVGKVNVATSIQRPVSYYVEVNGSSRWTNGDHWCSDDSKMTFWSSSGKTIFDPCPPGWRMPSSSEITGMGEQYFTSSRGFPASGYFGTEGAYYNPGNGTIWAATVDGACAKIQVLQDDQTIWSRSPDMGFNVRCVRE